MTESAPTPTPEQPQDDLGIKAKYVDPELEALLAAETNPEIAEPRSAGLLEKVGNLARRSAEAFGRAFGNGHDPTNYPG